MADIVAQAAATRRPGPAQSIVNRLNPLIALLLLGLLAVPMSLAAQAAAPTPPPAEEEEEEAEEPVEERFGEAINVTATKVEQRIQDVPFGVAAPTGETLEDRGADDLEDIGANVPGLTVQNLGPGQSQVALRGVSAGQIVRDQPGVKEQVTIYLDESPISLSLFTPDVDLFDVSRVEVLKGPQGTLFGSGSLAGLVRYITNQPQIGVSESFAELTLSSISGGEIGGNAKVAVNAPLGDTAAMRVTAYHTQFAGYMDAVQPGGGVNEDVNSGDRTGARLALRFAPNDRLTVTPRLLYQEVRMDGWNRIDDYNILANPFTTTRPRVSLGEREQFTQIEEPYTDDFLLGDLNVEYDFGDVVLTSITSYTDRDVLVVRDATALTASITGGSIGLSTAVFEIDAPLDDATTVQSLTQEVRLAGGDDRLNWVAGGFYFDADRDYGQSLLVSGFESATAIPTRGNFGAARDVLFFSDLSYNFEQSALFGEATWSINDRLKLTGGLRWYNFQEDRTQTFDGIFADPGTTRGSTSANGFAPRLIASYALTDTTRLNAQVAKGFRLGGINDPLNVPLCTPEDLRTFGGQDAWEDETSWNYEVGTKSTVMGGRGSLNLAAFVMDVENLQATVTAGSCSSRVIFNVPKSRSQGLELDFAAAAGDNVDFSISASYHDSELRSTLTSGGSVVAGIEKGNRLPTVPEFQMAASATYHWQVNDNWLGLVTGTYQHIGERFTQTGDQQAGFGTVNLNSFAPNNIGGPYTQSTFTFNPELPAYDIANLRLSFVGSRFEVAAFVNNITDERAFLALDQERGTRARVGYLTNQPRTSGVTLGINFK